MSLTQLIVNDSAQPALGAPMQASALQRESIMNNQPMAYGTYSQPQTSYIQNVDVAADTATVSHMFSSTGHNASTSTSQSSHQNWGSFEGEA